MHIKRLQLQGTIKIYFLVFFFLIINQFNSAAQVKTNTGAIYVPVEFPAEVLSDFISLLNSSTSQSWRPTKLEKEVKSGFILKLRDEPAFTNKESFRLESNGTSLINITSSSIEGLIFGFYKHLRSLGFSFYLPDELYTVIPSVANPFGKKKNIIDKPFLQIRNFAGTGGFGTGNSDTDKSVQKSWELWKLRNGFGSAYLLGGHNGETFILENKKKLQENPQWLARPLTGDYNDQIVKLNYQNNEAVNFYVDWTIKQFAKSNYKPPPPGHTDLVSIEPSDGGGYLNELPQNANKKLPSISDQVYGAANLAGKKLDKLFPNYPNIGVNMYAYHMHAEPPTFPLHPRVFVQLIPYQFQNVAYGPSFIKLWSEKVKRFGIYDYLKYADAQYDVPGGITLKESMQRLLQSVKSGSEGTSYETSYSKFSTGVMLWVIGRYMADGNDHWQQNLSILVNDLYGVSEKQIKQLFDLFYNEPSFNIGHLGQSISLLDKAEQLNKDQKVGARLKELKQYLYYTHLVFQSKNNVTGDLRQKMVPVAEYAWKIYESNIVHSYRIMQLISYSFLSIDKSNKSYDAYQQLHLDWFTETERSKTAWNKIPQGNTNELIEKNFQALKKQYINSTRSQPYSYAELKQQLQNYKPKKNLIIAGNDIHRGYFGVITDKITEIKIKYKLSGKASDPKITISSIDNNYTNVLAFYLDKPSGDLKFSLPAGESNLFIHASSGTDYRMEIKLEEGLFFFDGAPRMAMNFFKTFSDPENQYTYEPPYYPSYIFFPKNNQVIDYKVQLNALALTSPSGKKIATKIIQSENGGFEIRQFKIEQSETGKIWKAVITGNYNYNFINIPDRYFLLQEK